MEKLNGFEKKYLRGLAHSKKPLVFIGQKGISPSVIKAVEDALNTHELIKMKFNEFKEKAQKHEISDRVEKETGAALVGMIGHMAIFFRRHHDPEKRKIFIPKQ